MRSSSITVVSIRVERVDEELTLANMPHSRVQFALFAVREPRSAVDRAAGPHPVERERLSERPSVAANIDQQQ